MSINNSNLNFFYIYYDKQLFIGSNLSIYFKVNNENVLKLF